MPLCEPRRGRQLKMSVRLALVSVTKQARLNWVKMNISDTSRLCLVETTVETIGLAPTLV